MSNGQKFYRRIQYKKKKNDLKDQDSRYAINKIPISCFMAENLHTKNTSDAAADDRNNKKDSLRDAPQMFDGLAFINTH